MKICPICEHELIGSFCPVCRRVVKDPWYLSDGIYLNKSHYANEVQCEFHDGDRKITLLNQLHPADEKECSYHFSFDGSGFSNPAGRRKNSAVKPKKGARSKK